MVFRRPLLLLLLLLVAAIAVGDCFMPYGPYVRPPQWSRDAVTRQVVVSRQPVRTERSTRMVVRLVDDGARVQLTLPDTTTFVAGDVLVIHALITEPHNAGNPGEMDYAAYLRHQGVTGVAFCPAGNWRRLGVADHLLFSERMLRLRSRLTAVYADYFEGQPLAILAAMTLGDKSRIDRSTRELYSRTGSSHILALSGLHLSVLVALLTLLLRPVRRRWGHRSLWLVRLLTLAIVWTFVFLAALPVSLIRAATMLSIMIVLQSLHRSPPLHHTLIAALLVMLLVTPTALFDVGLQLSAVSVAAIQSLTLLQQSEQRYTSFLARCRIRCYPCLVRWQSWAARRVPRLQRPIERTLRFLGTLVLISLTAQVATFPLVAHYFGCVSFVGWLTSCIVVPMAVLVLTGSLLFLLLAPLRVWLSPVLSFVAAGLTHSVDLLHTFLAAVATVPGSSCNVTLTWWGVVGYYATLAVAAWTVSRLVRSTRHWLCPVAVLMLTAFVAISAERIAVATQLPPVQLAVYNRPRQMELHLVTPTTDSIVTHLADDGRHITGRIVVFNGRTLAVVDRPFPYVRDVALPAPMAVDAVLITRGAKGHLDDILLRYRPSVVVLDGCLTDYYRHRFAAEALAARLPLYDISHQGAFVLR